MTEPIERIISQKDYNRVKSFRDALLQTYSFISLKDEEFEITKVYYKSLPSSTTYYYQTVSKKPCLKGADRFTIIFKHNCCNTNSIAKDWDFKPDQKEEEKDNKQRQGQIIKYTPGREDFARIEDWKNIILDQCCMTAYKNYTLNIIRAYKQVTNGVKYFYELYPQGFSCGKKFKCTIFQSFGCGQKAPASSVSCGWGCFDPKDEDFSNVVKQIPRLADKALVEEMRDQVAKELGIYYSPSTTFDVEKVYEQEKEGADRIFYKIHPHGSPCTDKPMYFTVEVPDLTREGKIEVKKGWLGLKEQ